MYVPHHDYSACVYGNIAFVVEVVAVDKARRKLIGPDPEQHKIEDITFKK